MQTKTIFSRLLIKSLLTFLLFISDLHNSSAAPPPPKTSKTVNKNYLKTACNSTTYAKLCYSSLSPYASTINANDLKLCSTAFSVTLKAAKSTYSLVKSLYKQKLSKNDAAVVKDCMDQIGDSIYEIKQSKQALATINGSTADRQFQIDNIKTWVSAAITDEGTCTDELDDMKVSASVKSKIKKSVLNFTRLTSNSLALVNKLIY